MRVFWGAVGNYREFWCILGFWEFPRSWARKVWGGWEITGTPWRFRVMKGAPRNSGDPRRTMGARGCSEKSFEVYGGFEGPWKITETPQELSQGTTGGSEEALKTHWSLSGVVLRNRVNTTVNSDRGAWELPRIVTIDKKAKRLPLQRLKGTSSKDGS